MGIKDSPVEKDDDRTIAFFNQHAMFNEEQKKMVVPLDTNPVPFFVPRKLFDAYLKT